MHTLKVEKMSKIKNENAPRVLKVAVRHDGVVFSLKKVSEYTQKMMGETGNIHWIERNGERIWMPKVKGEELAGSVVELATGCYGFQLGIETSNGKVFYTPGHKSLQSKLIKFNLGNFIRIVFKGKYISRVNGHNIIIRRYSVFME
jgi:hypothetical protein